MPERPKGAGCKPADVSLHRFESYSLPHAIITCAGVAQLARALAFQAKGRGFESRLPLHLKLGVLFIVFLTDVVI